MSDTPQVDEAEGEWDRSVHGGSLGLEDQVLRAELVARLFGRAVPVSVGRFRVHRQIGAGGMGRVFEGTDPDSGRPVALKIVRTFETKEEERARARILREAQALARLSHPAVVEVYEAGRYDDGVYIAMELVEGDTLGKWQRERPRPWRDILDMYRKIGAGLAASHRRGLVHRDFKPDNVIVSKRGEAPKIVDFGLVQGLGTTTEWLDLSRVSLGTSGQLPRGQKLGVVVGTPAYMSPEQLRGTVVDARSDQYSFCLALHEALFGERPVRPEVSYERRAGLETSGGERHVSPPPAKGKVPVHVRQALERGLSVAPAARFGSMEALLEGLEPPRRHRLTGIAVAVLAATAVGLAWWLGSDESDPGGSTCSWVEEDLRPLRAALGAQAWQDVSPELTAPFATTSLRTARTLLETSVEQWEDVARRTCAGSPEDPAQSLAEQGEACLRDRWTRLMALASSVPTTNQRMAGLVDFVASELPDVTTCEDPTRLVLWPRIGSQEVTPARSQEVAELLEAWVEGHHALLEWEQSGSQDDESARALEAVRQRVIAAVEVLDPQPWPSVTSSLRLVGAKLDHALGSRASAIETFEALAVTGRERGELELVAEARIGGLQATTTGDDIAAGEEAWRTVGEVLESIEPHERRARLALLIARARAAPDAARRAAMWRAAVHLAEDVHGVNSPSAWRVKLSSAWEGSTATSQRDPERLKELEVQARAIWGAGHPWVARVEALMSEEANRAGRYAEALEPAERCWEAARTLLPEAHPLSVRCRTELAVALSRTGRTAEGVEHGRAILPDLFVATATGSNSVSHRLVDALAELGPSSEADRLLAEICARVAQQPERDDALLRRCRGASRPNRP